jgi:hypothetical protein
MDSRSLFHDLTLGVESSVAGMVTVLAVAEALSRVSISFNDIILENDNGPNLTNV